MKLTLWTESPVVVVLSGSMEPSMQRGDVLLLAKNTPIVNGDIIVYELPGEGIPIVHRVVTWQKDDKGKIKLLTKGDNNPVNDRGLYKNKELYITDDMVVGKVHGIVPYAGYLTIMLNDYPMLKFAMLGTMLLSVLLTKDPNA
eukprot:CAMPEP_0170451728 /NCGR_PEP_ID=MMETSP0123-20130129/872_1 /TAXON_ID=182087 /ORGANISM="Favella ehrenbergii, Strain Fehren 1" /LENGTH=142 /DNA_ID=CAMNT_0010713515 /DNA_START=133 /DNA_END=561 /DNA_ORIENTATION=-